MAARSYYWRRLGSLPVTAPAEVQRILGKPSLTTPVSPRPTRSLVGKLIFREVTLPFMATVLESPECLESPQASSSMTTCDLAPEAMRKQPGGQPGKANTGPQS